MFGGNHLKLIVFLCFSVPSAFIASMFCWNENLQTFKLRVTKQQYFLRFSTALLLPFLTVFAWRFVDFLTAASL